MWALRLMLLMAPAQRAAGLEYFGWYGSGWLDGVTSPHSNLYQAGSATEAVAAKALGQETLLNVENLFPGLFTASPDFKTKWLQAVPELKALLANKTIFGFGTSVVEGLHSRPCLDAVPRLTVEYCV